MSDSYSSDSGEDFSSGSSSADDGDQSDIGTEFQPVLTHWTQEQHKCLLHRIDDWKASKYPKAQKLVLQGAIKDLSSLSTAPPTEWLKVVCCNMSDFLSTLHSPTNSGWILVDFFYYVVYPM